MSYSYALDQQQSVLRMFDSKFGQDLIRSVIADTPYTEEQRADYWRFICRSLDHGNTYYWSPDLSGVLEAGAAGIPDWTFRREIMPTSSGFMLFATPVNIHRHHELSGAIRALSWSTVFLGDENDFKWRERMPTSNSFLIGDQETDRAGAVVCFWVDMPGIGGTLPFGVPLTQLVIPERMTFDDLIGLNGLVNCEHQDTRRNQKIAVFAAALEFLNQTIVISSAVPADRSTRRRLDRNGWAHEPLIRVVKLRRAAHESPHRNASGEPVEWSCQWVVRGHWRQQAVGKDRAERRPVFVLPYVKGDPDKPLKAPAERVFAVVR